MTKKTPKHTMTKQTHNDKKKTPTNNEIKNEQAHIPHALTLLDNAAHCCTVRITMSRLSDSQ